MQGKYKRGSIFMLDWVLQGYNARKYKRGSIFMLDWVLQGYNARKVQERKYIHVRLSTTRL